MLISIHAPHEGCDCDVSTLNIILFPFQSTHPMRGATDAWYIAVLLGGNISIHAPHEGCDFRR